MEEARQHPALTLSRRLPLGGRRRVVGLGSCGPAAPGGLSGCAFALMVACAEPAAASIVDAPSGQPLELIEAFWDRGDAAEPVLRLRFLAPEIGGGRAFRDVEGDFLHLCRSIGLARARRSEGTLIVITMLSRPLPFGTSDPETIQYIEAFRAEADDCAWEAF